MVDLASLIALQTDVAKVASDYGVTVKTLTNAELKKFGLSFERQFVKQYPERMIQDILNRHQGEILLGAMAAKEQMDANVDGEFPDAGKIGGPLPIRACWLGIGDDWEDLASINALAGVRGNAFFTPGSPVNWIHGGTWLLRQIGATASGAAATAAIGGAVRIGKHAVHVVCGLATYHPSPKIESMKFEIDGKQKPVLITKWSQLSPFGMRIKELDRGMIWEENTTILAKVFISEYMPEKLTQVIDIPYLFGATFIIEHELREHDPVSTSTDVITVA